MALAFGAAGAAGGAGGAAAAAIGSFGLRFALALASGEEPRVALVPPVSPPLVALLAALLLAALLPALGPLVAVLPLGEKEAAEGSAGARRPSRISL